MNKINRLVMLALLPVLLSACGFQIKLPGQAFPISSIEDDKARQLLIEAQSATPLRSAELKAQAAEALAHQGNYSDASRILNSIDKRTLPAELGLAIALQQARYEIEQNNIDQAINSLNFHRLPTDLNNEQVIQLNLVRAEAFELRQAFVDAARELISAANLSEDPNQQQILHNQIWETLQAADIATIHQASSDRNNNFAEQGWFERVIMLADISDINEMQEKLFDWQLLWEQHPAALLPPKAADRSLTDYITTTDNINRIALILPRQGQLAEFSRMITEGFMAALQASDTTAPEVIMLDSTDMLFAEQIFTAASNHQVDLIIGPLERALVDQLAQTPHHPIPVLALNSTREELNPPLQLDLGSDHEANTLVNQAILRGYKNGAIIRSDSHSGERFENLIRETYLQHGGSIIGSLTFKPRENNSNQIRELLAQDQQSSTDPSLGNTRLTVKDDADVIFLVATPDEAKLIRSMLLYHYAGNTPILASSHVFEGVNNPIYDTDLNGIEFVEIPWNLHSNQQVRDRLELIQVDNQVGNNPLFALGADAFLVSQNLSKLLKDSASIAANTGSLSMGTNRRILRELTWAQFRNGTPQL